MENKENVRVSGDLRKEITWIKLKRKETKPKKNIHSLLAINFVLLVVTYEPSTCLGTATRYEFYCNC